MQFTDLEFILIILCVFLVIICGYLSASLFEEKGKKVLKRLESELSIPIPTAEELCKMRSKIEGEIEDLEGELSLFRVVLGILELNDHNGDTIEGALILNNKVDDICRVEAKCERLKNRLHEKWGEHKKICDRLEDVE